MKSVSTKYGRITGPVVMLGFGSIGRGTLPLLLRHFDFDTSRLFVVDPDSTNKCLAEKQGAKFIHAPVTQTGYREMLTPLLTAGGGQGFCVNLTVDVSSLDVMKLCREIGAFYIDTVVEPWKGFYFDASHSNADRTNYALRETVREYKRTSPAGTTAISCCGANPGMVSWLLKEALLNVAKDLEIPHEKPKSREEWAQLMHRCGVKGVHIAERDTQRAVTPKPLGEFWNTWSVEGFLSEGFQPSELGWGTHERWTPANANHHAKGCRAAIWLAQPGANTRVRTWCPTPGPQYGFLVTHNEAISIADYYTVGDAATPQYRPTVHYAYHPCNDAVLSLHEAFGANDSQRVLTILDESNIVDGIDELGVLLYGHAKNAYWYGSRLSIEETRRLAPYQSATGMQVTSAVVAGMVWALENPLAGVVEADEMDHVRCLEVQRSYLGPVEGHYTDWTPLKARSSFFPEDMDETDPWQFKNILVRGL